MSSLLGISLSAAYLTRPEGSFSVYCLFCRYLRVQRKIVFQQKRYDQSSFHFPDLWHHYFSYMLFLKNYKASSALPERRISAYCSANSVMTGIYHEVVNAPDNTYDRAAFALTKDNSELQGWNRGENRSLKEYILKTPHFYKKIPKKCPPGTEHTE